MPITKQTLKRSYRGYFGSYLLTSGSSNDMSLNYSATPTSFYLFNDTSAPAVVTKEIEINMSTSGKVLLDGFGAGAALVNSLRFQWVSSNTVAFDAPFYKNNDIFDLATHITQFDFQTGFTFYKMRLSVIGVSDPLFDPAAGDNVIVTLNDDMTSRVVEYNWYVTGHYV